ncbi:hypothetical protein [Pseudonocardia lacus]|uniref:hypothetical protein n=1 Tax=Pseudonocardia lacus TaxID=2835865 RepID=UPI0020288A6E|nr:hypothetical protein [Pseudonocardia lacus]
MVTAADRPATWDLFRSSGEPRPTTSLRADAVTTALGVWFTLGLFVDAYAHANLPGLETFFTPWHAVFYSGFAAVALWILWLVWGHVREGRRGLSAVPLGYGASAIALPVFAVSGGIDLVWHEVIGIETTTDIFFSPSHLGLVVSMIVILTSPLRAAWARHATGSRPPLAAVLPAVLTLSFAASLVLLFLTYGNALTFGSSAIVEILSDTDRASRLAASIVITTVVLVAPLLLVARRWSLPRGTATIVLAVCAVISAVLTGFEANEIAAAAVAAGVLIDVLAVVLRPSGERRAAFWLFGFLAPVLVWAVYLLVASVTVGQLPLVTEFWTGMPLVAGLVGWALAALLLPNAQAPVRAAAPSEPKGRAAV